MARAVVVIRTQERRRRATSRNRSRSSLLRRSFSQVLRLSSLTKATLSQKNKTSFASTVNQIQPNASSVRNLARLSQMRCSRRGKRRGRNSIEATILTTMILRSWALMMWRSVSSETVPSTIIIIASSKSTMSVSTGTVKIRRGSAAHSTTAAVAASQVTLCRFCSVLPARRATT